MVKSKTMKKAKPAKKATFAKTAKKTNPAKTAKKAKTAKTAKTAKKTKTAKTAKTAKKMKQKQKTIIPIPIKKLKKEKKDIIIKAINHPLTNNEIETLNKIKKKYIKPYSKKWYNIRRVKAGKIIRHLNKQIHSKNTNPIIGIITIPVHTKTRVQTHSYLPQSYVKWIEMSGGRVVPIQHDLAKGVLDHLLRHIHGILIPGGVVETDMLKHDYYTFIHTCKRAFQFAKISNLRGNYYPIFGICLGHEIMAVMSLFKNSDCIAKCFKNCKKISEIKEYGPTKIHFTDFNGKIKNLFTKKEIKALEAKPVVSMHHDYSFDLKAKYIKDMLKHFDVASVNYGDSGKHEYASICEYKVFPFYTVQWHPEHALFEWRDPLGEGVPHDANARMVSKRFSQFFVNECRKNTNVWLDADDNLLIYNYNLFSRQDVKKLIHPKGTIGQPNRWYQSSYYFGNVNVNLNLY